MKANKILIKKVIDARNKIYAHLDPKPDVEYINSVEIQKLVEVATDLHNTFQFMIFSRTTEFSLSKDWDIDYVLWYMSELRRKDMEELEGKKDILHKKS